jgi:maltooligosyltrehalose trehalohydrolase
MTLELWAPHAEKVEIEVDGERTPMEARGDGWFRTGLAPGTRYAFVVDGDGPFPDPRSQFQPHGVHGPSQVVDHDAFNWKDETWRGAGSVSGAVIYEAHIGTFTPEGTFDAAIERLDHLVSLGVTHLELLPVNEFSGTRGWGYDGVDLYAPHHAYGGFDGLKRLVEACHERGLGVIMDVVYNHLGPAGNYLAKYGPYFTDKYNTPWGDAVNFDDAGSREVREFFIENALMWLRDYHCDGLRLDAIHAIYDQSAVHFLEELSERVEALEAQVGRTLFLIAESDLNDPRIVRTRDAHGYGMHAQWSDDLHHALHALLTGETTGYYAGFGKVADVAKALRSAFVYDGIYAGYRGRVHGRPTTGLSGHRFLGYLQTHDQVGNRAAGERISHIADVAAAKVGAALVLTAPSVPMLFQGEEWASSSPFQYFTDHEDPELGRAVSEGRTHEFEAFGWSPDQVPDPQDERTFLRSKLKWDELRDEPHAGMLDWYRKLIALRRARPELSDGDMERVITRVSEDPPTLVIERGRITIACNFDDAPHPVDAAPERLGDLLITSAPANAISDDLAPHSVAIWSASLS